MGRRTPVATVESPDTVPFFPMVFLADEAAEWSGPAGALLDKMLAALGLSRGQVHCQLTHDPARFDCKAIVMFGSQGPRGEWFNYREFSALVTHAPSFLLANPAAKKDAWEDLKKVALAAGVSIPVRGPQGNS
jgi:uracil-DNA glycosylase